MSDLALLTIENAIATVTLNRPDARNALSPELLEALLARFDELAQRADANVCIIRGAGKAFCAGMDLKRILDDATAIANLLKSIAELTLKVRTLPIPVIAQVHGAAIGGGCGLTCVCDFAITHAEAKIGYPEVDLGVCPAVVAPWLILRVGAGQARRILLQGGTLSGARAYELGLVTQLTPADELENTVMSLAERLAKAGPGAISATKTWLNQLEGGETLAQQVRQGAIISAEVASSTEAQERLRAAFSR